MALRILKGHWRVDGGLLEPGKLEVEVDGGRFADTIIGGTLTAARYPVCPGILGVKITSSECAWEFLPDEGECRRIGMPIA